jgi:hypothetical protein
MFFRAARLGAIAAAAWLGLAGGATAGDDPDTWQAAVAAALSGEAPPAAPPQGADGQGAEQHGGWRTVQSVSRLTDATQYAAALASQDPMAGRGARESRAVLVVRCLEGELGALIAWPQAIDHTEDGHTIVLMRLDHGAVTGADWDTDRRGNAAGIVGNVRVMQFLARLDGAKELVVRLPSASVQDAVFTLEGVAVVQAQAFAACHIGNTEDFGAAMDDAPRLAERIDASLLGGQTDFHEAWVRSVEPDSIAQHAGLRKNDEIYEFDGHRVEDMDQLLTVIRATPAGKLVEVKVMRVQIIVGARPLTLHAQF